MSETSNPPVATPDVTSVVEDETLVSTGNVLANDTDPNGLPLSVAAVDGIAITGTTTIIGTYGTLVIQPDGDYTYTLADNQANVRALANGQVVPDTFTYTVSDGQTYTQTTPETVQNLIPQSEAFNDPSWVQFGSPVITPNVDPGPNGGASTADEVTLTNPTSGIYYQTNVAGTYTFSVWVRLISGDGDFALNYYSGSTNTAITQTELATGVWQQVSLTFTGDGNTFSNVALMHNDAQSATGTFEFWGAQLNPGSTVEPYVPTSGSPVTTTVDVTTPIVVDSTLTVDVTGNTPVAMPDTASVAEGGTLVATGNVLANDTDGAGKTLSVVSVNGIALNGTTTTINGAYGTLVIQANGQYTYTLASGQANVLALTKGQMVQDAFTYTVSDGNTYTHTTTQTVQNLIPQSEAFNDPTWVQFSSGDNPVVTPNVGPGPNGGPSTADAVTLTSPDSGLYYQTNVAGTYTFSVWVRLINGDGNFALNYYSGSVNQSDTETLVANGTWQQVSLTFTGDGNTFSNVALMHAGPQSSYGMFEFWGAQLNPGSTIEPYVPTSGSPVTTVVTSTTPVAIGSTLTVDVTDVVCFAAGTCIDTPLGMVSVENLSVGDMVLTHGGAARPVRWIGQRFIDLTRHSVPERAQPIRILADAFADGIPRRDLVLSPDHAVLVDGMLVPIRLLANRASIVQEVDCQAVCYFHIELDSHDVLLAEGLPAESYLDTGNRRFFGGAGVPALLYPDAVGQERRETESCAPFAADTSRVRPIWRRLAERCATLGHRLPTVPETTDNPHLEIVVGGRCLPPIVADNGRYVFALPATDHAIWLTSRTAVPNDVQPWIEDRRRLGVMVSRLTLLTCDGVETIPLDHPSFSDGWWAVEWHGATALRRWTDGQARLPIQTGHPTLLEVELGNVPLAYPITSSREHRGWGHA